MATAKAGKKKPSPKKNIPYEKSAKGRRAPSEQMRTKGAVGKSASGRQTKPAQPEDGKKLTATDVEFYCYFSYLGPFWFIGLFSGSKNKALRFHINQGMTLFVAEIAGTIAAYYIGKLLALVPYVGMYLSWALRLSVIIAACALSVYGMIGVARRIKRPLPVIGGLRLLKK